MALLLAFAALLAAPARAGEPAPAPKLKPCVFHTKQGWKEPATLQDLLDCQTQRRQEWVRLYHLGHADAEPAADALDALDDSQRAEASAYAARHPDRARTDSKPKEPAKPEAEAAAAADPVPGRKCRPPSTSGAVPDANAAAQQKRTAEAMRKNDRQADPGTGADLDALNASLLASSQNGALGISPDGARSIVDYLECEQGEVSPDMQALLDQLSHDGGKLSDQSMVKLKQAARSAKDAGLDLGVDSKLEGWLLDPTTDPGPSGPGSL